jgi:hypothetical protein
MSCFPAGDSPEAEKVRELARLGQLAEVYAKAAPALQLVLRRGVHEIACQVVFQRITIEVERRRQHGDCLRGVPHMRPDCLDRFLDAVEVIVYDTLHKARVPILRLDAWLAPRVVPVTVDDHRSRRGGRGAQQKPYVPQWLRRELGDDPWLVDLALMMLTWVGIPDTAGPGMWPVDAWADRRARVTGVYTMSDPAMVRREIALVLAAMRHKPDWCTKYIERPLDHKPPPVTPAIRTANGQFVEPPPLELVSDADRHDEVLYHLAARCLDLIRIGIEGPERDRVAVVREAIRLTFCADRLDPGQTPYTDVDPDVDEMLSDPAAVARMVDVVFDILVRDRPDDPTDTHRPLAG